MKLKSVLTFATCLLAFTACSTDENEIVPVNDNPKEEPIVVSLNMGGDGVVTSEAETRGTATNDIYGINVYYDKESDGTIDDVYAYGLFNNKEDMTITLLTRHVYRFECSLVKNGANTLFYGQAFSNKYSGYCFPFQTSSSNSTMVENKFNIGTGVYLSGMKSGAAHLSSVTSPSTTNANSYASISRFYGETDNYTPVEGGQVDIFLKRTVFGAKFIISGMAEGTLTAKCGKFWSKKVTADEEGDAIIYSYPDVYDCWQNDSEHEVTLTLKYVSRRGNQWNFDKTQQITFKRNTLTTVNINVDPDLSSATTTLTAEDFGDDNNIDLYINASGLIDIWVNPNEE